MQWWSKSQSEYSRSCHFFCMFSSEMLSQGCLIQFGYVTQWALVQYCMVWVDDHSHQLLHAFDS